MRTKKTRGQHSWEIATPHVRAYITRTGGHVGPVSFHFGRRRVEPFSIAPWAEERIDPTTPPVLRVLRGDFFCMPFGGNATPFGGERHPVHGEVANEDWSLESLETRGRVASLHLSLRPRVRRGRVDKRIMLIKGHRAIYSQHVVSGMSGRMCMGHHAMLKFPEMPGSGVVSMTPFQLGRVFPEPVEKPENRGYSILRPGAEFNSLDQVATITGEAMDLGRYPARRGYEDLVMVASDDRRRFCWTAVTFPGERYVWFALKDPSVLRSTILWFSNGGRHYPPWSGRHVSVLGLEEVTANFHYGLAESARVNAMSRRGIATSVKLDPRRPLVVNYVMAVAEVPRGFDKVAEIEADEGGVRVVSSSGKSVLAPLDLGFLSGGRS
jgi:hypothetical protein